MKITITVDCSAEEAREMLGLPNVRQIQDEWLQKVGEKILADVDGFTPDKILGSWVAGASSNMDMFAGMMNSFMQGAGKPK